MTSKCVHFIAVLQIGIAGCQRAVETPRSWPVEQKLVDLPFVSLDPPPVDAQQTISERVLWQTDCEGPDAIKLGLARPPGCRLVARADGQGHALEVRRSRQIPTAVLVAAAPERFVRLRWSTLGDPRHTDLVVLETRVELKHQRPNHPEDLRRVLPRQTMAGSHVNLSVLLGQHRLPVSAPFRQWTERTLDLFTHAETRSILLLFQTALGVDAAGPVQFDDLRLSELLPSPGQRLQLVRQRYGITADKPGSFAQFLARRPSTRLAPNDESAYEYRHGLLAPAPSTRRWRVRAPPGAHLDVGLGLVQESAPGASIRCTVRVDGKEEAAVELDPARRSEWRALRIGLAAEGETTLELSTEATPDNAGAIAVWSNPTVWTPRRADSPPNVLLIAIDTLRADRLSAYGYSGQTSPHLEAFAAEAVLFEQVIAQSNWTPESFATLFTSTFAGQHGITERLSVLEQNRLASELRRAGYLTQGIAYKLLLYDMGFERGFDAYFNTPRFHLERGFEVRAELNWQRLAPWLDTNGQRNFFLFAHFDDPHQPFNHDGEALQRFTPAETLAQHGLTLPILIAPYGVRYGEAGKRCRACGVAGHYPVWFRDLSSSLYDGAVAHVDRHLGALFDKLRQLNIYDDTLIVVLSDHGEGLGEHEQYIGHGFHHLYEEQLHVPLLIKPPQPSTIVTPARISQLVPLIDVMPTVLELAGLPVPTEMHGRSLVELMRGGQPAEEPVISENVMSRTIAVRSTTHRYVLRYGGKRIHERLFDLVADRAETRDASNEPTQRPALVALRRVAVHHLARTHAGHYLILESEADLPPEVHLHITGGETSLVVLAGRLQRKQGDRFALSPLTDSSLRLAVRVLAPPDATVRLEASTFSRNLGRLGDWPTASAASPVDIAERVQLTIVATERKGVQERKNVGGQELEALRALGYVE